MKEKLVNVRLGGVREYNVHNDRAYFDNQLKKDGTPDKRARGQGIGVRVMARHDGREPYHYVVGLAKFDEVREGKANEIRARLRAAEQALEDIKVELYKAYL